MFEIFSIGFLSFTFIDLIDIIVVTSIIYYLYRILKGTIAAQIFIGLVIVLLLSFLAQAANFKALGFLLRLVTDIWVIAFIILFQPEIRRLLLIIGRQRFLRIFEREHTEGPSEIITNAAFDLAQHQHGALMVIVKSTGLRGVIETGEIINAQVSKNLLRSIFYPRSPMHDGAVIIKGGVVEAARCTLPLSQTTEIDGIQLGMRHRAGLGISEEADVLVVIVSEETGSISVAENGKLSHGLSRESLRNYLLKA